MELLDTTEPGYLSLFIGPMYSGKTSKLIEIYNQYKYCDMDVLVINYNEDTRYTKENLLSNHNKIMIPCICVNKLSEVNEYEDFINSKVILINEGQFFNDIVEWVKKSLSKPYNKIIYVSGLDGDFKKNTFGNWLDLIPHAEHVEKLKSICMKCKKKKAPFTTRISNEKEQKVIGTTIYKSMCRQCFDQQTL